MARVKLTSIIYDIAGRFGGGVFRNWKGLHILSVPPSSVSNPNTNKQALVREVFSVLAKAWRKLSIIERDEWSTVAGYLSSLGDGGSDRLRTGRGNMLAGELRGPYTPIGALVACHGLLSSVALWETDDALIDAPISVTCPTPANLTTVAGDDSGLVVTWTDPEDWGNGGSPGAVQVWGSSECGTFFPQIAKVAAAAAETATITHMVPRKGIKPIPIRAGQLIKVQLRPVNAEGLPGPASETFSIIVTAHA